MSIRWIRNVVVDGRQTTFEVLLGDRSISDKCYVRLNQDEEYWFRPSSADRQAVLRQGLELLKSKLQGRTVTDPTGSAFAWH
jgi:hypothetical protein